MSHQCFYVFTSGRSCRNFIPRQSSKFCRMHAKKCEHNRTRKACAKCTRYWNSIVSHKDERDEREKRIKQISDYLRIIRRKCSDGNSVIIYYGAYCKNISVACETIATIPFLIAHQFLPETCLFGNIMFISYHWRVYTHKLIFVIDNNNEIFAIELEYSLYSKELEKIILGCDLFKNTKFSEKRDEFYL